MGEKLWKFGGVLLLVLVILIIIGIIISGVVGFINISDSLILFLIVLLLLLAILFIRDPSKLEAYFSQLITGRIGAPGGDNRGQPHYHGEVDNSDSSTTGFDRILEVAEEESDLLADNLRRMRAEFDDISCEDVARTIAIGIQTQNDQYMTPQEIQTLIESREFIESLSGSELRIINEDDEILYARLSDISGTPTVGLKLGVYFDLSITDGGDVETFPKQAGTAEIAIVEDELCELKIISWSEHFNPPSDDRIEYIMSRNPRVKFDDEIIEGIDWDEIEVLHETLKQPDTGRGGNYAD